MHLVVTSIVLRHPVWPCFILCNPAAEMSKFENHRQYSLKVIGTSLILSLIYNQLMRHCHVAGPITKVTRHNGVILLNRLMCC